MLKSMLIAFLLFSSSVVTAHQSKRGKVTGTYGPYFYQSFPSEKFVGANNPLHEGFMILTEGGVDKNGGVEIGLSYMHQLYFRRRGDWVLVEKAKRMHASTGYRHWFNPHFSGAVAFYNAYSMGDVAREHRSGNVPPTFKTSAREIADNGMDFSIQYEFLEKRKNAWIVDLRYSYSFSAYGGEVPDMYGIYIGYKQFIQTREKDGSLMSR